MRTQQKGKSQKVAMAVIVLLIGGSVGVLGYRQLFARGEDHLHAQISVAGEVVYTVDLTVDGEAYELDLERAVGVPVTLEVRDHAIRFLHAECPDQVCVHAGWQSRDMDLAICMPNRTSVLVVTQP